MVKKKVTIAVDLKFFNNVFETKRKQLQRELNLNNLSQADFTKMIEGLKLRRPKINITGEKNK